MVAHTAAAAVAASGRGHPVVSAVAHTVAAVSVAASGRAAVVRTVVRTVAAQVQRTVAVPVWRTGGRTSQAAAQQWAAGSQQAGAQPVHKVGTVFDKCRHHTHHGTTQHNTNIAEKQREWASHSTQMLWRQRASAVLGVRVVIGADEGIANTAAAGAAAFDEARMHEGEQD